MSPAEAGGLSALLTAVVSLLTWFVTARSGERSFTANEEQAFAARLQREIEYLSGELARTRQLLAECERRERSRGPPP